MQGSFKHLFEPVRIRKDRDQESDCLGAHGHGAASLSTRKGSWDREGWSITWSGAGAALD